MNPSDQLELQFRRARSSDPSTSHAAAARVTEFDGTHFGMILRALKAGSGTQHDIAARAGLHFSQVHKRLPELESAGRIRRTGRVGFSPTNRPCIIWEIVEA